MSEEFRRRPGDPHTGAREDEIKKQKSGHLRRIGLLALFGGGAFLKGPEMYETATVEYRKFKNANPEQAKKLAEKVMELTDAVEEDGEEIFRAKLEFHIQMLINLGESEERIEKTRKFFTELFEKFQKIKETEEDKKKVLFGLFQNIGRYEPGKARISDIANTNEGNCDARTQALTLLISGLYPELPVQVQFFGSSKERQSESHSRVLVNIDGILYSVEGELQQVTDQEKEGTVVTGDTVFEASIAYKHDSKKLVQKTNAQLLKTQEEHPQNDPDNQGFGQDSNSPFDVSLFTGNATATYGPGGGISQAETQEAYQERMKNTPTFGDPIEVQLVTLEDEEYQPVPLPEEILEEAIRKGKLILSDWDEKHQRTVPLPFFDLSRAFRESKIKSIIIRSSDRRLLSMYYKNSLYHFNFLMSDEGIIFYFTAYNEMPKWFQGNFLENTNRKLLKTSVFFRGKIELPNFGPDLESVDIGQIITRPEEIISLEDLRPLYGKRLKKIRIHVYGNNPKISFNREDLLKKGIISKDAHVDLW